MRTPESFAGATEETHVMHNGQEHYLLARWTGGRINATLHRVIGRNRQRYSVPFFYEPSVDTVISPLPGGEVFEPVSYGDHLWEATTQFVEQKGIAHLRPPRGVKVA